MCLPTHPRVFARFGKTKGEIRVEKGDFRGDLGVWTLFGNQPPHPPTFGKDLPKKNVSFWMPSLICKYPKRSCVVHFFSTVADCLYIFFILRAKNIHHSEKTSRLKGRAYFKGQYVVKKFILYLKHHILRKFKHVESKSCPFKGCLSYP